MKVGRKNTAVNSLGSSEVDKSISRNSGNDIIINDLIDFVNSYTAKNININGIERPVFNSSGKRIAKTQEGLRAFYEWFGDSKVVDEQGRPLIVYHGTNADFDTFKKEYAKDGQYRKGFFFTSDKSAARMFGDIIMPVYLKAETDYRDAKKTGKEIDYIHPKNDNRDVYIVFDPNQIKSVDNRGSFSKESENIYHQGQITDKGYIVELTINSQDEMQNLSDDDFKNKMLEILKSFKGKEIFNKSLNGNIEIRTSSIKKYKSFFADKNKRLIVPYIPELLGKAKFVKEDSYTPETESNIIAYWKANLPINIDSNMFNVYITVKQDNNGNLFWDAQVQEKTPRTDPATNPGDKGLVSELSEDTLSITPAVNIVNKTFNQDTKSQVGHRGQYDASNRIITLFSTADPSTIIHETAHFFLDDMRRFSDNETTKQQLEAIYKYVGSFHIPNYKSFRKRI